MRVAVQNSVGAGCCTPCAQGATEASLGGGPDVSVPDPQLVREKAKHLRALGGEPRRQRHEEMPAACFPACSGVIAFEPGLIVRLPG